MFWVWPKYNRNDGSMVGDAIKENNNRSNSKIVVILFKLTENTTWEYRMKPHHPWIGGLGGHIAWIKSVSNYIRIVKSNA